MSSGNLFAEFLFVKFAHLPLDNCSYNITYFAYIDYARCFVFSQFETRRPRILVTAKAVGPICLGASRREPDGNSKTMLFLS